MAAANSHPANRQHPDIAARRPAIESSICFSLGIAVL
jgi:hypothetical protein